MDLKTCLVVFTLVIRFTEVYLETDEKQPYLIHTRGFGKRSLDFEREDAPNMIVKRGFVWSNSKLMRNFEQSRQRNMGRIQTEMKNPANVQAMLADSFGKSDQRVSLLRSPRFFRRQD